MVIITNAAPGHRGKNLKLEVSAESTTLSMEATTVSLNFFRICLKPVANRNGHKTKTQKIRINPSKTPTSLSSSNSLSSSSSSSSPQFKSHHYHDQNHGSPDNYNSTKHITHLVETFHENQRLKNLLKKLYDNSSSSLQILKDEGDWSKDQFWTVIRFLKETSRTQEILQVFDLWKNIEKSRINEDNYMKIIGVLVQVGLMEEAVSVLQQMKDYSLNLSVKVYNCVIHGFASKGEFGKALQFFNEMLEMNLKPETKTYNGLIEAYGNYGMYSEMSKCVKKMESNGCSLDSFTYNLLTVGYARGGLLNNMERAYQTLLSKRMDLRPSTLVAMLEAYVNVGLVKKMEYIYQKVLFSKALVRDSLVRKMASVYIKNYMYSRLDELGNGIASRTGRTDLVWCLRLLSHACLLSRKGMESIVWDMEGAKFSWSITVVNIMGLAYLKMKDFKQLDFLLSKLVAWDLKPDIVTIGVLFDANAAGFDGTKIFLVWRRMGFLEKDVEMNTDPLVLAAFRKGSFLRGCEEMFSSLGPDAREKRVWTYHDLIDMVFKHTGIKAQVMEVK